MPMEQLKSKAIYMLSMLVFLSPFTGINSVGSVLPYYMVKNAAQGYFEANTPMPEVRDTDILAVMDTLAFCESGYVSSEQNNDTVTIVDVNGYRSYGRFQFQLATFKQYAERYGLIEQGLTNDEIRPLLIDGELQDKLVYKMLDEDRGNLLHWLTCTRMHNLS
jgi:muramidase (phage lysozyme)